MRRVVIFVCAAVCTASAATVKVSDFGFDPADSTRFLQAALDSDAGTVVIDNKGGPWITRPLFIRRDNLRIVFEPGVVLAAKPGGFPGVRDSLVTATGRSHLTFSGYGATLRMEKAEYTSGEWRMVLNLLSCSHVVIEGLTLRDSGGDGIYLGNAGGSHQPYCLDVTIRDVVCDNNRRQGISVISARDLLIEGSLLANTNGTAPQAGIDFEPNHPDEHLVNCVVRNTRIENNTGACMLVASMKQDDTSPPLGITFEKIYCGAQNAATGIAWSGPGPASGTVTFRDVLVTGFKIVGVSGYRKAAYRAALYSFERVTFRNIGKLPLGFSGTSTMVKEYGGARFTDVVVHMNAKGDFLGTVEAKDSLGLANVKGNVTVVTPFGAAMQLGVKAHENEITVKERKEAPSCVVKLEAAERGFAISRSGEDVSDPLAVVYELGGMAANRLDYAGLPGVAVIPAGATRVNVAIIPRNCGNSSVRVTLPKSEFYSTGAADRVEIPLACGPDGTLRIPAANRSR